MTITANIILVIAGILLILLFSIRHFPKRSFTRILLQVQHLDIPVQEEILYVNLNYWKEYHHILFSELEIVFELSKEKNLHYDFKEYSDHMKSHIYDETLAPGQERSGKQIFFYTFRSDMSIENNLAAFISFLQEEYISDAERRRQNEYYWSRFE